MKKYLILIIILLLGCKNIKKEKLVCNYQEKNQNSEITFYFENNESVKYQKVTNIKLPSTKDALNYKNDNYDKLEVVDNQVNLYTNEKIEDMTKEEIKSIYEKFGYTCKEKNHQSD